MLNWTAESQNEGKNACAAPIDLNSAGKHQSNGKGRRMMPRQIDAGERESKVKSSSRPEKPAQN